MHLIDGYVHASISLLILHTAYNLAVLSTRRLLYSEHCDDLHYITSKANEIVMCLS